MVVYSLSMYIVGTLRQGYISRCNLGYYKIWFWLNYKEVFNERLCLVLDFHVQCYNAFFDF